MPQTMFDRWKLAKKEFEKQTKKAKPVEKVFGHFRKSTGIEKALNACDKAAAIYVEERTEENGQTLQGAITLLTRTSGAYLNKLRTEIELAAKAAPDDDPNKVYRKGLKFLKTTLEDCRAHFEDLAAAKTDDTPFVTAMREVRATVRRGRTATATLKLKLTAHIKKQRAQELSEEDGLEVLQAAFQECSASIETLERGLDVLAGYEIMGGSDFPDPDLVKRVTDDCGTILNRMKRDGMRSTANVAYSIKRANGLFKEAAQI